MSRRVRRPLVVLAFVALLVLVLAPVALGAAGGGSSGFGGGGGGGRGRGLGIAFHLLFRVLLFSHGLGALFVLGLVLIGACYYYVAPRARSWWGAQEQSGRAVRRKVARRERRVELAAAEAAEDDAAFAPDSVREHAAVLFTEIQAAWDADDRSRLRKLVAPALLDEWERRLDDFDHKGWRNRVQPLEAPTVDYVGLQRGGQDAERVVVRIEARLRDYVEDRTGRHIKRAGALGDVIRVREFWTLGRQDERWMLLSIEQGGEGTHALADQIAPTPWSDEQALRDEALVEGALAETLPEGTKVAEVADLHYTGDARVAALDLSLADGRFAPDVLEVSARRAVAAWAEAVDGDDGPLRSIASLRAASELLHPGDPTARTRLVVRGLDVREIRIVALDPGAEPPTMTVDVELSGRRYVEDRDTGAVISGSRTRRANFTEHWILALNGDRDQPWRIVSTGAPVGAS